MVTILLPRDDKLLTGIVKLYKAIYFSFDLLNIYQWIRNFIHEVLNAIKDELKHIFTWKIDFHANDILSIQIYNITVICEM